LCIWGFEKVDGKEKAACSRFPGLPTVDAGKKDACKSRLFVTSFS
jgi:hypothetical protein